MKRKPLVPDKKTSTHRAAGQDKHWVKGDKRFLARSLGLHVFVVAVLLFSWSFSDPVKQKLAPASIQARVLSAAELEALRDAKQKVEQQEQRAKQEELRKKELDKKRRLEAEKKRKQAQDQKKARAREEQARKQKQAEAQKQKALKRKQEAERIALKKKKEEQARLEEERKAREAEERTRREKERERKLAERLAEARKSEPSPPASSAPVISNEQLSEKDRFAALIRSRVESRWHIPPKSRGLKVVLQINLLPSGESSRVGILTSSGNQAFDNSALNAARAVRVFPVPQDPVLFDAYFRKLIMSFSPPEQ
ncbi:MAG: hypothetical protein C9356_19265 [Oleiphilus sp.]|nr:MAG: hypothetical protein C9356_19265 [Oleiphilus sp.]